MIILSNNIELKWIIHGNKPNRISLNGVFSSDGWPKTDEHEVWGKNMVDAKVDMSKWRHQRLQRQSARPLFALVLSAICRVDAAQIARLLLGFCRLVDRFVFYTYTCILRFRSKLISRMHYRSGSNFLCRRESIFVSERCPNYTDTSALCRRECVLAG